MTIDIRKIVTELIEANTLDNLRKCPHRNCNMLYHVPEQTWLEYPLYGREGLLFSSKSCPYHYFQELRKLRKYQKIRMSCRK